MSGQLLLSLIVGISIGGVAAYLGTLMLSRRMALVAGPLGHLTLPGIALALIYGFDVSLGAFPFVVLGIILIWLFEMRTKLPMEALTAVVFLVIMKIYQKMILINISEDLAKSQGISAKKFNLVYLFLIAIIVALGAKVVGGLLTAALVAIPACSARNLSQNMFQYVFGAIAIGIVSSFSGIFISEFCGFPAGPLIILANAVIFLISIVFKR